MNLLISQDAKYSIKNADTQNVYALVVAPNIAHGALYD